LKRPKVTVQINFALGKPEEITSSAKCECRGTRTGFCWSLVFVSGWTKLSGKTKWLYVSSLSEKFIPTKRAVTQKPEKTKDLEYPPIPGAFRPSVASNWPTFKSGRGFE